jgi:uncharacterized YccA/Bax inhibitor family protein
MPSSPDSKVDLNASSRAEHFAARRDTVRDLVRTCGHVVFWVLAGWMLIGFSAHSTNETLAWILYWAGYAVWIPGVLFSLLAAYRRGEKRGAW